MYIVCYPICSILYNISWIYSSLHDINYFCCSFSTRSATNNIERFENIYKSPRDKRSYRGLKLANDMKILLISDPSTATSAAALSVGVGKFRCTNTLQIVL